MLDFTTNDLSLRARRAQLEREADAIQHSARLSHEPRLHGFRARMAARLAHLALHLDGETAETMVSNHLHPAGS